MENNKSKGNSKEFQAEEIDKRYEMDTANPLPADQTFKPWEGGPGAPTPILNADHLPAPNPQTSSW